MNHIKLFEHWINESATEKENLARKLLNFPIGPIILKVYEWLEHAYTEDAQATYHLLISKSGKELAFYVSWEFDSDIDYNMLQQTNADPEFPVFKELAPGCKVETLMRVISMPEQLLIGVVSPGGNKDWLKKVNEFYEENGEDLSEAPTYMMPFGEDVLDIFDEMIERLGETEYLSRWFKSGLTIEEWLSANRGNVTGKRFGL